MVYRLARELRYHGYVKNNGTDVLIEVAEDPGQLIQAIYEHLPPLARIEEVRYEDRPMPEGLMHKPFFIMESGEGSRGVGIPNDSAICPNCVAEMFNPSNRRYLFPFTNCTDCGARFTIIKDLPYDRVKTAMEDFPMCDDCKREFEDPHNRRFHHQTISCPVCGPRYYLVGGSGERINGDPVDVFASYLDAGKVGIIKSWGGMHICTKLDNLQHLREWYRRKQKPFAIMVRDLEAARRYSMLSDHDAALLASAHRPIVLVKKIVNDVTELVSPGLGNIGIFLPYTEMQHLLFHRLEVDALVMTSANIPGEPMVLNDSEALTLGADIYLLHDRKIINRCDDSVIRSYKGRTSYIRRSRGAVPFSLRFPYPGTAIGLGAQENIAGSLAFDNRLHCTQYIGDSASAGVLEYLSGALGHLRRLLGVDKVDSVGIDLHPGYSTRRLGFEISKEFGSELVEVQHHWAHALALMLEHDRENLVTITVDGTGYGTDGKAWGGEVLDADHHGFERVGHLQELPLLGGEKAVHDVRRLVFAARRTLGLDGGYYDEDDSALFDKMLKKSTSSTSLGRVLDATACALDICQYRSYDGEPAMKLERWLEMGKIDRSFNPVLDGNIVRSVDMFSYVLDSTGRKEDVASTYVNAVVRGLVEIAARRAKEKRSDKIGLTGGVSYNSTIVDWVVMAAKEHGLEVLTPLELPNGDGCISAGQCLAALAKTR